MAKKLLAVLLCLGMAVGMLAGCGDTKAPAEQADKEVAADTEVEAEESVEEPAEEPAEEKEEPTNLTLIMFGEAMARNSVFWEEEFTDKILEDINCTIDVVYIPWGASDQLNTILASGEPCMFMGPNATHLSNGYVTLLDEDHIREVAPNYIASRMSAGFNCVKTNGKVYGLPTGYMVFSNMYDNFVVRDDLLQQVGWSTEMIKTHEDLLEAAEAVHKAMPGVAIVKDVNHFTRSFDAVYSDNSAIIDIAYGTVTAVNIMDEESDEVINWLKSDWCETLIKMTEMWYERGLITPEHVTDQAYFESQAQNDNCLLAFGNPSNVYYHGDKEAKPDIHLTYLKLGDTPNHVSKDYDWCWGISAAAEDDADKYLALLDWSYASKDNYMFSVYGVEGLDWEYNEDGSVNRLVNDGFFYDWMYKTYYYQPIVLKDYQSQEELDEYMAYDETAIQSKLQGFVFDQTSVETEFSLISAVLTEQAKPIYYGLGDYEKDWPGIIEALDSAGLDTYVAEYQKQFSEFMANK